MKKIVYLILSFFFVGNIMAMKLKDMDLNNFPLKDSCSAKIEHYCASDTSLIRVLDTISKTNENVYDYAIIFTKLHGSIWMQVYQIASDNDIIDWFHGTNDFLKRTRPTGCIMFNSRAFYFTVNNLGDSIIDKFVSKIYKWQILKRIPEEKIDKYAYFRCDYVRLYEFEGNGFIQHF